MRVFLDTNVLASGLGTRGLCADVIREVLTSHELVISETLLKELERALRTNFKIPATLISEAVKLVSWNAHLAEPDIGFNVKIKDKDDIIILSSAINGDADIFVTGDKELLGLKQIRNLVIASPREFWQKVKAS